MEKINLELVQSGINTILNKGFWFCMVLLFSIVAKDWFVLLYRSLSVKLRHDFRLGDIIEIEGYVGEVISMSGFRIRLLTKEGHHVIIPISMLFDKAHKVRGHKRSK